MEKLYLLDAYALIYRAYYALIRSPRFNSKGQNTSAIFGFVNTLEEILNKEEPTHIAIAFDPSGPTFRHEAFPQYKAQRESTPEDIKMSVPIIKEIIRAYNIPILELAGYEADDIIGTFAFEADKRGIHTWMVTPDKDYGQLVTDHVIQYKPNSGGGFFTFGVKEIQEKYGIEKTSQVIDILGLMGDKADNVPGCPGIGEKTAISLIEKYGSIEGIYESINDVKGKLKEKLQENKEQVLFSKFLVTIKTDVPLLFSMDTLKRRECDKRALRKIFEQLEFKTFIKKVCDDEIIESAKMQTGPIIQYDLFSEIPDKESEKIICENFKPEDFTKKQYKLIDNQEVLDEQILKILSIKQLSFSIATTSLNAINAQIIGFSFSIKPEEAFYVACGTDDEKGLLKSFKYILESSDILKIGYNLKFIRLLLLRCGINLGENLFDIMIAHYVIQPELKHYFSYISEIYLHYPSLSLETYFGSRWHEERDMRFLPDEILLQYQCEQVDISLRLKPRLESELINYDALKLFQEIEMPLVSVLADMEKVGVPIDRVALKETSTLFTERLNQYEQAVIDECGHPFNLSSPRQVGDVLFGEKQLLEKPKKTKNGQYVTSEAVLEELRYKEPIVDNLLKYRGIKKLLSTYVDALPNLVNYQTNRIHTSFNQAITSTGRLSSSNPNLQNIPVRGDDGKEIRKAFIPEPGQRFFSADYSQIELRIMAHLSQDEHLIEAFLLGQDIHAATAAKVYHKPIEEITSEERRKAKTANFGIIYGITVFGLAQRIGISRGEAKELIENYFNTFPLVQVYLDKCVEIAREKGYVETIFKRRRYLPDIKSSNAVVRGYAERNAVNAPIQGSAADIIKVAMNNIRAAFIRKKIQSKMILQVHDELNFSVLPEEESRVEQIVKYEMEHACSLLVPLLADCGWGANWLEAH